MPGQQSLEFGATEEKVVAKANELIRGRHEFSTVEQRIFVSMVAQLSRDMDDFPMQEVRIEEVWDVAGACPNNIYSRIDDITDNLVEKTIEVRRRNEEGRETGFTKYPLFKICEHERGSGVIRAKFNEEMSEFLLDLKERFTLYLVTVFLRLRSKYSTQIYEMLKMRQDLRKERVTLQEFRERLALEDKYPRFSNLKRRVIEKAREELKEKADIYFTYHVERQNNSPQAIEFFIHDNEEVIEEIKSQEDSLSHLEEIDQGTSPQPESSNSSQGNPPERGPDAVNGLDLFLENRSQAELASLNKDRIRDLYEEARTQVSEAHPDQPHTYIESRVVTLMEEAWDNG
ncbi:plasmid replication initiation protein [Salinibacter ruber]|jgi:plasmid replication initiation protein|uniref:replication initiation protein n=1 Tax=Salinibacter ruber TaxID=146919 RepID=UPI002073DB63|nr:replication initiation protein [Salinibacter ruber]MCS3632110.1 plasmid replication initiation protein [Salinibacter ruber]MCS3668296.1 plasmid replication initiation protein [Salinibacter ruber]MCS3940363.1 plasmid replication initiation protein [Salinibacter ruber]